MEPPSRRSLTSVYQWVAHTVVWSRHCQPPCENSQLRDHPGFAAPEGRPFIARGASPWNRNVLKFKFFRSPGGATVKRWTSNQTVALRGCEKLRHDNVLPGACAPGYERSPLRGCKNELIASPANSHLGVSYAPPEKTAASNQICISRSITLGFLGETRWGWDTRGCMRNLLEHRWGRDRGWAMPTL